MDTTADTTDLATEKMDVSDPEINGDAQKAIMALRMLFEDFADQVQYQDEIQEESASESEISPERTPAADPSSHLSHVLPFEEREDVVFANKGGMVLFLSATKESVTRQLRS